MQRSFSVCVVAFALVAASIAATSASASVLKPGAWVNGRAFDLVTGDTPPTTDDGTPLYIIAAVDVSHPQHPLADAELHSFGIHDHVFAMPARRSSFSGVCEQMLLVPGPKARVETNVKARVTNTPIGKVPLLYRARLGNALLTLTSAARIRRAQALGLARTIHTNFMACRITPH